ncbi:hypothetical protein K402DRAFT_463318 [Aulographum hederae CBS 113979]|uniref:Uncharacterized protein n=1 Tax=Aulographum hederae CBS 113979 TaxID=1176131 RepID=A0A6G1H169_9PEZI|nr:hypothetical protein K402DRAFT_463318 [Aulographum hederae CBS 113979]
MSYEQRRTTTTRTTTTRNTSRRSAFGYWIPLAITVTLAAGGLAAWIWSERDEHDEDTTSTTSSDEEHLSYGEESSGRKAGPRPPKDRPPPYISGGASASYHVETRGERKEEKSDTFLGRVTEVVRRTPSPQQVLEGASKRVAAGVAAAGAVVGGALSSIREEDKDFEDHSRWSEEVRRDVQESSRAIVAGQTSGSRSAGATSGSGRRRTVAIVVSAEPTYSHNDGDDDNGTNYLSEQASLLSHLPPLNPSTTTLLVLIYAPHLARPSSSHAVPPSLGSSYSAISTPAQTPGEELQNLDPPYAPTPSANTPALSARDLETSQDLYESIHRQAERLVERSTCIMPFGTLNGYTHMLKHLQPDVVYLSASLAGAEGESVRAVKGWVGQIAVVVGGDAGALGGLVDTEDEEFGERKGKGAMEDRWWEHSDMVGLGKGVEIVDSGRLGDDFERRVGGKE